MIVTIITKESVLIRRNYVKRVYHRKGKLILVMQDTNALDLIPDELIREYSIDPDREEVTKA